MLLMRAISLLALSETIYGQAILCAQRIVFDQGDCFFRYVFANEAVPAYDLAYFDFQPGSNNCVFYSYSQSQCDVPAVCATGISNVAECFNLDDIANTIAGNNNVLYSFPRSGSDTGCNLYSLNDQITCVFPNKCAQRRVRDEDECQERRVLANSIARNSNVKYAYAINGVFCAFYATGSDTCFFPTVCKEGFAANGADCRDRLLIANQISQRDLGMDTVFSAKLDGRTCQLFSKDDATCEYPYICASGIANSAIECDARRTIANGIAANNNVALARFQSGSCNLYARNSQTCNYPHVCARGSAVSNQDCAAKASQANLQAGNTNIVNSFYDGVACYFVSTVGVSCQFLVVTSSSSTMIPSPSSSQLASVTSFLVSFASPASSSNIAVPSSSSLSSTLPTASIVNNSPTCPANAGQLYITLSGSIFLINCPGVNVKRSPDHLAPRQITTSLAQCINSCDLVTGCQSVVFSPINGTCTVFDCLVIPTAGYWGAQRISSPAGVFSQSRSCPGNIIGNPSLPISTPSAKNGGNNFNFNLNINTKLSAKVYTARYKGREFTVVSTKQESLTPSVSSKVSLELVAT